MLGHPEDVIEAEEALTFRALEFYISTYLRSHPRQLKRSDKIALRICCKRFKTLFDAAITTAEIDSYMHDLKSDNAFLGFCVRLPPLLIRENEQAKLNKEKPFQSLDLVFQMFPSLKDVKVSPSIHYERLILPESVGRLTSLTTLEVTGKLANGEYSLPSSFTRLTALKALALKPFAVEMIGSLQHLTLMEHLRLKIRPSICGIPDFLGTFALLTYLNFEVGGEGSCSAPESINTLKQLKELHLSLPRIETFPEIFENKPFLTFLEASFKGVTHLPESIGNLTALEKLDLHSCSDLETLPHSLGNLKKLKELSIRYNSKLLRLPHSIGNFESLEALRLVCCPLTTLPDSIGELNRLNRIDINSCTHLITVPESITNLTALESLYITDCEYLAIPKSDTFLLLQQFGRNLENFYLSGCSEYVESEDTESNEGSDASDSSSSSYETDNGTYDEDDDEEENSD